MDNCMTELEAISETKQGGLWTWLHEKDTRLYRSLQGLNHHRNQLPTTLTLVKALDAAGFRLVIVPKEGEQ